MSFLDKFKSGASSGGGYSPTGSAGASRFSSSQPSAFAGGGGGNIADGLPKAGSLLQPSHGPRKLDITG